MKRDRIDNNLILRYVLVSQLDKKRTYIKKLLYSLNR
jgi:hypothetical protein